MRMNLKKLSALALSLCLSLNLFPCAGAVERYPGSYDISLKCEETAPGVYEYEARLDNQPMEDFDYTWTVDPGAVHDTVKDAPAENFVGTEPVTEAPAYVAHDITYYPSLDPSKFVQTAYDGEWEYAYYYTAPGYEDYIFSTLPMTRNGVPTSMMHTPEEAATNPVLHIVKPGVYVLHGNWRGQIWVDLGSKAATDESAKVTLVLNNLQVDCAVAPGLVFRRAYECDNGWESRSEYSAEVDTSAAGANIIIADGSDNSISGTNIFRMLKPVYKDETAQNSMNPMGGANSVKTQKKQRKIDGAVYSYVSMNISGESLGSGILNINSQYEGLDSELHLTVNGGNIRIKSQDDGINVNEDNVSVFSIHGGNVHILAGLGVEGDGIDSNGYLMMTGGTLISMASPFADSGMDSERGTYIKGGTVVALGSTMDWAEADETGAPGSQASMNLRFAASQSADEAILVATPEDKVVFAYDPSADKVAGGNARWYMGAIVSSPVITVGNAYHVYVGGDVQGNQNLGVYDASTVNRISPASKLQCYSETANLGGFRPGPPPGDFDPNNPGAMPPPPPDGMGPPPFQFDPNNPGAMPPPPPDGMGPPPGMPMGNMGGENPENLPPEAAQQGGMNPGGMGPPPFAPGGQTQVNGNGIREFVMGDRVNGFSGVTDYTGVSPDASPATYQDTDEGAFYYDAMRYVTERKIMSGINAERFDPNGATTRLMVMTSLARMDGVNIGDAPTSELGRQWAMNAKTPAGQEISNGERMDESVTRQQFAAMLYRYVLYRNVADTPADTQAPSFTDAAHIEEYAKEAVQWCAERGIIQGYEDGSFRPGGTATRAHMAVMLQRFDTFLKRFAPPQTLPPTFDGNPEAPQTQGSPPVTENPEAQERMIEEPEAAW